MSHPCADHPCDHCYLCDVVGICCQTVAGTAPVAATTPAAPAIVRIDPDEALRQAILAEQHEGRPILADLIRAEVLRIGRQQPLLLPAPQPVQPLPVEHRVKEVVPNE
jgi:hypothetical protein